MDSLHEVENKKDAIKMTDFKKAFDVINIDFVKQSLSVFNFGPVYQAGFSIVFC